jgi:hypothetical protein
MDNNYNNDQNYSGAPNSGAAPEPQYGSHSFTDSVTEQYDTQAAQVYDPQQSAPDYGSAPASGSYPQQDSSNYGSQPYGAPANNGYPQQGAPNYGGPVNGGYPQQGGPNYGGQPMNGYGQLYPVPNFYTQVNDPYSVPPPDDTAGKAVYSLVIGIVCILLWCIPIVGLCLAITGLIFGIQALKGTKKGMAIAGTILSALTSLGWTIVNKVDK